MAKVTPHFRKALATSRALALPLPDSRPVEEAYVRAGEASAPWLFNHVVRSWLYSVKLAQVRILTPDPELLAVAVLLHDLGLTEDFAPDRRVEVTGADLRRDFVVAHGLGARRAEVVWNVIALHTTPSIGHFKGATVAYCQVGIGGGYGGFGYQELAERDKQLILSAYPRLKMKEALTTCLCGIAQTYPETTRDNFLADFGERYVPGYQRILLVDLLLQTLFAE